MPGSSSLSHDNSRYWKLFTGWMASLLKPSKPSFCGSQSPSPPFSAVNAPVPSFHCLTGSRFNCVLTTICSLARVLNLSRQKPGQLLTQDEFNFLPYPHIHCTSCILWRKETSHLASGATFSERYQSFYLSLVSNLSLFPSGFPVCQLLWSQRINLPTVLQGNKGQLAWTPRCFLKVNPSQ